MRVGDFKTLSKKKVTQVKTKVRNAGAYWCYKPNGPNNLPKHKKIVPSPQKCIEHSLKMTTFLDTKQVSIGRRNFT